MAPSKRHYELQSMVIRWISNRSFKMCGVTEADCIGYLADYVAIAGMHDAEHTRYTRHSGLTKKCMIPLRGDHKYEINGDIDRWYICVFEVKVSRSDFLNTFNGKDTPHAKARMKPVGTAHWVVADKGVCKPEELPDFWGLLTPYGAGLSELKMPKLNVLPDSRIHAFAFDLLWLNMNYRSSSYYRYTKMYKAIKHLNAAIIGGKPNEELLQLSGEAIKACT